MRNGKPLAIDLYAGLGGWSDGLIAEGWSVIGYDIERHEYGDQKYPGELVIQDVLTIHGSQFKDADLIVASPPCQEFSYMAMPWRRGKQIAAALRGKGEFTSGYKGSRTVQELTALFDACFRIQREASEAAGRYIPIIVENVRGAQPWVGRARWAWGSFLLWGDVPALMPITQPWRKSKDGSWDPTRSNFNPDKTWDGIKAGDRNVGAANGEHKWSSSFSDHLKSQGMNWSDQTKRGQDFTRLAGEHCGHKTEGVANIRNGHSHTRHLTNQSESDGVKGFTPNGEPMGKNSLSHSGSKSNARKAASAMIAKIPLTLSTWIARVMKPPFPAARFACADLPSTCRPSDRAEPKQ